MQIARVYTLSCGASAQLVATYVMGIKPVAVFVSVMDLNVTRPCSNVVALSSRVTERAGLLLMGTVCAPTAPPHATPSS